MDRPEQQTRDYALRLQPKPAGCDWIVTRGGTVAMSGRAADPETAERCGGLAVGALRALGKIARRRF
jgi:hypothetical protein